MNHDPDMTKLYVYRWRLRNPRLGGKVCRVIARGTMNSALVEFEDGERGTHYER